MAPRHPLSLRPALAAVVVGWTTGKPRNRKMVSWGAWCWETGAEGPVGTGSGGTQASQRSTPDLRTGVHSRRGRQRRGSAGSRDPGRPLRSLLRLCLCLLQLRGVHGEGDQRTIVTQYPGLLRWRSCGLWGPPSLLSPRGGGTLLPITFPNFQKQGHKSTTLFLHPCSSQGRQ